MKQLLFTNRFTNRVLLLALITGITTISSCDSDLLNKKPLDAISEDAVFNDPVFLQNYVYNVYNGVRPPWNPGSGGYETLTDIAVDQPETHDRSNGIRQYYDRTISPDNITSLTNVWNDEYSYIRKANIFFEEIETSTIAPDALDPMKGEMHFLRAWMYFELMRTYGGVPIITNSFQLDAETFDVPRNTYDECADFVLSECDAAIDLLDGVPVNEGKISKNAALALKARVLLYSASPLNNPSNDIAKWQAAEAATKLVLDAGYTLHPTQHDLFTKPLKK